MEQQQRYVVCVLCPCPFPPAAPRLRFSLPFRVPYSPRRPFPTTTTTDDDFSLQFDSDLLRVDLDHSLMEVTAMVRCVFCLVSFPSHSPAPGPLLKCAALAAAPMELPTTPPHHHTTALTHTHHPHTHQQLQQQGDCPLSFAESETPVPSHHHQQQQPPALQRPVSQPQPRMGHLQARDNGTGASAAAGGGGAHHKHAYPFTPVPSPDQHPPQDENGHMANLLEQSTGSVTSSVTCGSSTGSGSTTSSGSSSSSSSSGKKAVAPRINVRLMPQNSATAARVRQAGYNPKLELSTPLSKRVGFFVGHLASKWSNVRGIGALSLRLAALPAQQLDEDVPLRSLSAHFAAAKKPTTPTAAGTTMPSSILQLHYVLVSASSSSSASNLSAPTGMEVDATGGGSWLPEENSLFDAFAATGLDQLPVPPVAPAVPPQQPPQVVSSQQPKQRKRISLTTGDASNRNDTFVNAMTFTPAPSKFVSSTSSTSSSSSSTCSFESSGENSQGQPCRPRAQPGSEKKKRRIRPTLLPVGEKVATSPGFLQAQCGMSSFTSESSRQSCFSNSGEYE